MCKVTMNESKKLLILLITILISGCSPQVTPTRIIDAEINSTSEDPVVLATSPAEEDATECPGEEINRIGQSIAMDYDFTSYDQVMAWFCEGAEFEDILVALETQALTDEPADEMLQMLADGLTWNDIWILVGLED